MESQMICRLTRRLQADAYVIIDIRGLRAAGGFERRWRPLNSAAEALLRWARLILGMV